MAITGFLVFSELALMSAAQGSGGLGGGGFGEEGGLENKFIKLLMPSLISLMASQ